MVNEIINTDKGQRNDRYHDNKEIARLWRIPFSDEVDRSKVEHALQERVKELNCLYGVSLLAERHFNSLDKLLEELADFIPHSWQYPDIACARIIYKGEIYKSKDFQKSEWWQSARIYIYSEPVGEVAIFYKKECPPSDEGPFLAEERALIDSLADQIGTIATRISAELEMEEINKQLVVERKALQESNAALKAVLRSIEEEKHEINRNVMMNIDRVVMPILFALSLEIPNTKLKYIEMLKNSLEEITSPFINHLADSYRSLSPTEIAVCNMIKNGCRTKEIAKMRGVSIATVNRQRESIRRKLSIDNCKINLATHLQSSMLRHNQG